jgi:nitronate monooxygenase
VQIGTAFLITEESGASVHHRRALLSGKAGRTELTKGFTGRLARGIHNQLLEEMNHSEAKILPYPLQRALVKSLSVPAEKAGRQELLQLWAGQSANLSREVDAKALFLRLVSEISEIAGPVLDWTREQTRGQVRFLKAKPRPERNQQW